MTVMMMNEKKDQSTKWKEGFGVDGRLRWKEG